MAARRLSPVFTENFANNLEAIRLFLEPEGKAAFRRLLDRLFHEICPTLCRFPLSGRPFLGHEVRSLESRSLVKRLETLLQAGDDIREFVLDDYLLLYLRRAHRVIFLAIKHHRQLSFDLDRLWP
jgi:plasmid stabilization system protein ParE